ncbi:MAG: hypothetical protein OEZ22_13915 [Spirochaetia bacterium]|nr:hypothetical protein [Spirochaetia bacterium]
MKKIQYIIVYLSFLIFACAYNTHKARIRKYIINNEYNQIVKIFNLNDKRIFIVKNKDKNYAIDILVLVLDTKNNVQNSIIKHSYSSGYNMYFYKNGFIFTMDSLLINYDFKKKKFYEYDTKMGIIDGLIKYKNYIYLSRDKTEHCIRRLDINSGEIKKYNCGDYYLYSTPFYSDNDNIYGIDNKNNIYIVMEDDIVKTDIKINKNYFLYYDLNMNTKLSVEDENKYMKLLENL